MTQKNQSLNPKQKNKKEIIPASYSYQGPIPHPKLLAEFNQVVPGSAKKIIEMAESQTQHRINIESKIINSDIDKEKMGMIFSFILGLVIILSGVIIIWLGYKIEGLISLIFGISSLIGVFIYGKNKTAKELEEKISKGRAKKA